MDKLDIKQEMAALDAKDRDFYSGLTDEQRRSFSTYLMIRWSSSVSGGTDLQEYYLRACNTYVNRHFFAVNRHPQLQWLMATCVSPGLGRQDHRWIAGPKRQSKLGGHAAQLQEIYPMLKSSDIDLMLAINDAAAIKQHVDERLVPA